MRFNEKVDPDPEVSPSALGALDFSGGSLYLQTLAPAASVYGGLEEFHDFLHECELGSCDGQQLLVVEVSRAVLRFSLTRFRQRHRCQSHVRTPPPQPPPPWRLFSQRLLTSVWVTSVQDLAVSHGCRAGGDAGAALRRRERHLRSWWRHEKQSVRMALCAAAHHSFDKVAAYELNNGPRAQKTDRAEEEEEEAEVREVNDALAGMKRPPPGDAARTSV